MQLIQFLHITSKISHQIKGVYVSSFLTQNNIFTVFWSLTRLNIALFLRKSSNINSEVVSFFSLSCIHQLMILWVNLLNSFKSEISYSNQRYSVGIVMCFYKISIKFSIVYSITFVFSLRNTCM